MRAVRMDKVALAGLAVTLREHVDHATVAERVPVHAMLEAPVESLQARAAALVERVTGLAPGLAIAVEPSTAYPGGGSMPGQGIPSIAVVGYTNCGKTSLIKALTGRDKLKPRDQLFATLDVTVHEMRLPSKLKVNSICQCLYEMIILKKKPSINRIAVYIPCQF